VRFKLMPVKGVQPFWFNSAKQNPYSNDQLPVPSMLQGTLPPHPLQVGGDLILGQVSQPLPRKRPNEPL
jgi:hypothetical protein